MQSRNFSQCALDAATSQTEPVSLPGLRTSSIIYPLPSPSYSLDFSPFQSRRLIITYECYPKAQVSYTRPVGQIRPTRPLHAALTPLLQLRHPLSLAPSCLRSREHRGGQNSYARSCTSVQLRRGLSLPSSSPFSGVGSREEDRTYYRSCASLCSCAPPGLSRLWQLTPALLQTLHFLLPSPFPSFFPAEAQGKRGALWCKEGWGG